MRRVLARSLGKKLTAPPIFVNCLSSETSLGSVLGLPFVCTVSISAQYFPEGSQIVAKHFSFLSPAVSDLNRGHSDHSVLR